MKHKYQAYAAATQTVAKTQQIVMLYDGAIRFVQQAKEAIKDKRIEDRYNLITKATDVVAGLQGCLDFENGGDIARVLYNFYASIESRLFSVHRSNSAETCDEVIADLKQMRDVWQEIDRNQMSESKQPAQEEASAPAAADAGTVNPTPPNESSPVTLSA
jgi:flagellar secretion chaperone FliS